VVDPNISRLPKLILKPGREKSLLRRHPWIFSGAVQRVEGDPQPGETVAILAHDDEFLASAAWSPASQIAARVWSFDPAERIDAGFFERRIRAAIEARPATTGAGAMRLINAESDGLPGLVVDRYGRVAVLQATSAGAAVWKRAIADALLAQASVDRIYERSDSDVMELEGLAPSTGWLHGGGATRLQIEECGLRFIVDIARGHKTGFYLDQRENRDFVGRLAAGREVLNCFGYTGGFAVHALAHAAVSVLSIESSAEAIALAAENVALNGFAADKAQWLEADVFRQLRELRDAQRLFDLIVLDPPKFAPTPATAERAARGYKDINLLAFKLLRPGGLLATFSCSGGISRDLFQKIVAGAAVDAGVDAVILRRFEAAADHPVSLHFPEGEYLKGLLCRKGL
jgi:23S rRNA (cytosine1962-C5)-methyltransferase